MNSPGTVPRVRAEAAFAALDGYAAAHFHPGIDPGHQARDSSVEHGRITDLLTGLMDYFFASLDTFSFGQALDAGREQHRRYQSGMLIARRPLTAGVSLALGINERARAGQVQPVRPELTTVSLMAQLSRMTMSEATTALTGRLLADLQHYAGLHRVSFSQALSASRSSHTAGLIASFGTFEAGTGTDTRRTAVLPLPAGAEPFRPVSTGAGVVISCTDAEWLLIRAEARIRVARTSGGSAVPADTADRHELASALASAHGTSSEVILARLGPAITGRARDLDDGPAAAAGLGYRHGITGAYPWARHGEGEELLLTALGETEGTSEANTPHRWDLINAYLTAYDMAQKDPAARPARHARRDFPADLTGFLPRIDPSALIRQAARHRPPGPPRRPARGP